MTDQCFQEPVHPRADSSPAPQGVLLNDLSPFIHKFQTLRQKYVYDVNTRRIVRVSDVVWDVLDDLACLDEQAIVDKHADIHDAAEVTAALRHIADARDRQGLFLSFRPKEILPPPQDQVGRRLDEQREQLILNVTEDCNFRCSYCIFGGTYSDQRPHSSRSMTWEIARLAIDDFLAHSGKAEIRTISFYGGEPLLNLPLIRQCAAHVRRNDPRGEVQFALTTNGWLLHGEAAEFLAAERFSIVISLDGPCETHDRHRRTASGEPSWAQIISNFKAFLAAHPEYDTNGLIRFNSVATRTMDLCQAKDFWGSCDLLADSMGLMIAEQRGTSHQPRECPPDDPLTISADALYRDFVGELKGGRWGSEYRQRARWVQAAAFQRPFVAFHKRGYISPHLPKTMVFLTTCIPGTRRAFVSAEGGYYACERVVACPGQAIGNVSQGISLSRVMNLLSGWTLASQDQCRHCWCLSHCNMGCFATADDHGKITPQSKANACAAYRQRMHRLLVEYSAILEENPKAFDYTADIVFQ